MKRQLLMIITPFFMLSTALFCQKGTVFLGLGPTAGFPVSNNNFSYYYKNGFGGSLQSGFGVSKLGSITIYASYISIGAKHPSVTKSSLTLTKIGYRTNFSDSRFFVSSDAGIAQYGSGSRRFVISGTAGYSFKISNKTYIDLFPSYNQIIGTLSNSRWLTANILYRFNLRKK